MDSLFEEIVNTQKGILDNLQKIKGNLIDEELSFSARSAEKLCLFLGSWKFIGCQSILIILWIGLNFFTSYSWDSYPFILLNLFLSFQAATASPIILMSQNHAAKKDRKRALDAYESIDNIEQMLVQLQNTLVHIRNGNGKKD